MFVIRSLYYSIFVALRMLPILTVTAFTLYLVIRLLVSEPLALIVVVGAIYIPLILFLYLNALRCALVAMKETGPPEVAKFWQGTVRMMRFSFLLNNLVVGLLGMGGTVVFLMVYKPDVFNFLFREIGLIDFLEAEVRERFLTDAPIALIPIWTFAMAVSAGVVGTSAAATAAWVAERGPNYDTLWGVTEGFSRLFVLGIIMLVMPAIALVVWAGGPFAPVGRALELHKTVLFALPVYISWVICVIAAGKARAFADTARNVEARFQAEQDAMLGAEVSTEDMRALRIERMERAKMEDI